MNDKQTKNAEAVDCSVRQDDHRVRLASFALKPVRRGVSTLDFGCGFQAVQQLVASEKYLGVDLIQRTDATLALDLNVTPFPENLAMGYELATLLGFIGHLDNPGDLLQVLCKAGISLVLSHKFKARSDGATHHKLEQGKRYTKSDIHHLVESSGYRIAHEAFLDSSEFVIYAHPSTGSFPWGDGATAPKIYQRPKVVLAGFFGRGNCGDEALLQSVFEALSPDFEITISVDFHGSHNGFLNWHPYSRCEIVHQCDISIDARYNALIICGGGLGIGFLANQILSAKYHNIKTYCLSVDPPPEDQLIDPPARAMIDTYYGLFDRIHFRTDTAFRPPQVKSAVSTGGDVALLLEPDNSGAASLANAVLVTLREWDSGNISEKYIGHVLQVIAELKVSGLTPIWLPFAPEDTRLLEERHLLGLCPVIESWWNPRRVMEHISKSAGLISIGRLHPILFAKKTNTPVASFEMMPNGDLGPFQRKITLICQATQTPQLSDLQGLREWIQTVKQPAANEASVCADLIQRLQVVLDQIREDLWMQGDVAQ